MYVELEEIGGESIGDGARRDVQVRSGLKENVEWSIASLGGPVVFGQRMIAESLGVRA